MIDDESDYFATETGTWLTNSEKAALQKREEELRSVRHSSRRDRKITFDFAGRRIVETAESVDMYNVDDDVIQQVHYGSGQIRGDGGAVFTKDDFCNLVNPDIETNPPKVSNDFSNVGHLYYNSPFVCRCSKQQVAILA